MTNGNNISTYTCKNCLRMVRNDGKQLQYKEEQTKEIYLVAIANKKEVIKYVKNQSEELCIATVKQDQSAIEYVCEEYKTSKVLKTLTEGNKEEI